MIVIGADFNAQPVTIMYFTWRLKSTSTSYYLIIRNNQIESLIIYCIIIKIVLYILRDEVILK